MKRAGWLRAALGVAACAAVALGHQSEAQVPAPAVRFERVTAAAGLTVTHIHGASPDKHLVETMGSGAVFFDYDNDGWIDIFLVDGGSLADRAVAAKARHQLLRNRGNGTFEDVTAAVGIRHREYGQGACAGDFDNDGRVDLYITNLGPNLLYRNTPKGFVDVTATAGVGSPLWSTSCAFADFDRDGFLDLFVANYLDAGPANNQYCGDPRRKLRVYCHPLNYKPQPGVLYRGSSTGVFADVSQQTGIAGYRGNGLGVVVGDYNDDRWPDIFVANDAVPNFLFRNDKGATFSETALAAGVAVARDGKPRAGMGTDFGDYNRDGRLDLIVTNHEFETHSLFRNEGSGLFTDVTIPAGLSAPTRPFVGFGTVMFDYDNDGWLDLAIVNGHVVDNTALVRAGSSHAQRRLLFRNERGRFVEVGRAAGAGFAVEGVGRTLVAADVDNDGDLDLLVTNNGGAPDLLRNDGSSGNALLLKLVGTRSNRDGIGARVRVTAGGTVQLTEIKAGSSYLGQNDTRLHFGLGPARIADRIEIQWPSGHTESLENIAANRLVRIREGEGIVGEEPLGARR